MKSSSFTKPAPAYLSSAALALASAPSSAPSLSPPQAQSSSGSGNGTEHKQGRKSRRSGSGSGSSSSKSQRRHRHGDGKPLLEKVAERRSHEDAELIDLADEEEERDYYPPPENGPHTLIEHSAFRFFWGVFFGRAEHVKMSYFCSTLLKYLGMPASVDNPASLPIPPNGYGLPTSEIMQFDRGSPRSLLDGLALAIDLDDSGRVTAAMLGRVLFSLPTELSLRDTIYLLAEQRGKIVLPPPSIVSEPYIRGMVQSLQLSSPGGEKSGDLYSPFALHGDQDEVFGGRSERWSGVGALQDRLEANLRVPGWSLVGGRAGTGRSSRVVAACRAVLHLVRLQDPHAAPSVAASVSVSEALLDPLSFSSSTVKSIAQLGSLHRLDAMYIDFRASACKAEVLSAMASQLGLLSARTLQDSELQVLKLMAMLKPGSALLLDNVSADCCAILTSLLDPLASKLSIVVISSPCQESINTNTTDINDNSMYESAEERDEREQGDTVLAELVDELGARLVAPHQGSVNVVGPLSRDEGLQLARRFWLTRYGPGKAECGKDVLELAVRLSNGYPGLLKLLMSLPKLPTALKCLSAKRLPALDTHRTSSYVTAEDVFFHSGAFTSDDLMTILALWPLRGSLRDGSQRLPFDSELAWHLCREPFESQISGSLPAVLMTAMRSDKVRERWRISFDRLVSLGWLEKWSANTFVVSSLADTCRLPTARASVAEVGTPSPSSSPSSRSVLSNMAATLGLSPGSPPGPEPLVSQRRQWDLYFSYWAERALHLNGILVDLSEQEEEPGSSKLEASRGSEGEKTRSFVMSGISDDFPHFYRLASLWIGRQFDEWEEGAQLKMNGVLSQSDDAAVPASLPTTPKKASGIISPLQSPAAKSASGDDYETLSPSRLNASLHLSILNASASADLFDGIESPSKVARSRSLDTEKDVGQQKEQERNVRRKRRALARERRARDEREITQPSGNRALALTLAGRVGALSAARLTLTENIDLVRALAVVAYCDTDISSMPRTLRAYTELGCALLTSPLQHDLEEARSILKDASSLAEALSRDDSAYRDSTGALSAEAHDSAVRHQLSAQYHYARSLLCLSQTPLESEGFASVVMGEGDAQEGADEEAAEELGAMVAEQVAFRLLSYESGSTKSEPSWRIAMLADVLSLQGLRCLQLLRRLLVQGVQGLVTVNPFATSSMGSPAGFIGANSSVQGRMSELAEKGRALLLEAHSLYIRQNGALSLKGCEVLVHLGSLLTLDPDRRGEAKENLEQAIRILNRRGDGSLAVTAHALFHLASIIAKEPGREGLTRLLHEEALDAFKRVYPTDHPLVTTAAAALGTLLTTQMRYDRAIELYDEALVAARRAVSTAQGKEEVSRSQAALPPVLVTLAALHDKTGRYSLAISLYRDAVTSYRELFGSKYKAVAETLCLLAECVDKYGRSGADEPSPGDLGVVTREVMEGRGGLEEDAGNSVVFREDRHEEAQNLANEALAIYRALEGSTSPNVIRTLRLKAMLHQQHGSLASAKACFEHILSAFNEAQLGFTEDLAESQYAFADLLCLCDEHVEALALYQLAAVIYRRLFGDGDLRVAEATLAQGQALIDLEQHEEAQPVIEESLGLFLQLFGPDSARVAECYHCLGLVFQALEEHEEAKEAYRAAVYISTRAFGGETHTLVAKCLNNLASVYDDLDDLDEAARLYDQGLQILRKLHGDDSALVLLAMDNLLSVLEDKGAREEALILEAMFADASRRMLANKQQVDKAMERHWTLKSNRRLQEMAKIQQRYEDDEATYSMSTGAAGGGGGGGGEATAEMAGAEAASASLAPIFAPSGRAVSLPTGSRLIALEGEDTGDTANRQRAPRASRSRQGGALDDDGDAPPPIREDDLHVDAGGPQCAVA